MDAHDTYLVLTFAGETRVLGMNAGEAACDWVGCAADHAWLGARRGGAGAGHERGWVSRGRAMQGAVACLLGGARRGRGARARVHA